MSQNNNNNREERPRTRKRKIIIAVIMICIAFFGSFFVYFILQVALNTPTPVVVVVSGSMEPTIHKGDLLFVCGVEPVNIRNGTIAEMNGDIIVFDAQGLWGSAPVEPIVHRVVDKYQLGGIWYFRTKGDANPVSDPEPIPESRILGVVCGGIPYIGWVKIVLTEWGLLIPILVIVSALLIISIVRDVMRGEEEEDAEEELDDNSEKKPEIHENENKPDE